MAMAHRLIRTIATEKEEEVPEPIDSASLVSNGQRFDSWAHSDAEIHRIAAEKYAEYKEALTPALELEGRLIRSLHKDNDEDEATHLKDGNSPGWSVPCAQTAIGSMPLPRSAAAPIFLQLHIRGRKTLRIQCISSTDPVTPWSGSGKMDGCATDWRKNGSGCKRTVDCASAAQRVGVHDRATVLS